MDNDNREECTWLKSLMYLEFYNNQILNLVNFFFLISSILRSKWFVICWVCCFEGLNGLRSKGNFMNRVFLGLKHLLFNNDGFSRDAAPVLLCIQEMGQNSMCKNAHHSETVAWKMWWLFACCFRIQRLVLEWNSLSPMLCIQLHSWPVPLAASHLWLFSFGHCFMKSLKTYSPPFLLSSWCQVWQEHSVQKETLNHIMNQLTPIIFVDTQEKVNWSFLKP